MSTDFGSTVALAPRSATAAASQVVVGLGNDLAGDDGVGIYVARALQRRLGDRPDVDAVALPWAGFALLDALAGRRRAWIVDCLTSGRHPPGTVVRLDETDFAGSVRLNSFHDIGFGTVMGLGRRLGWPMPAEVSIWAIEGGRIGEFAEGLTRAVAAAAERVIAELIRSIGATP